MEELISLCKKLREIEEERKVVAKKLRGIKVLKTELGEEKLVEKINGEVEMERFSVAAVDGSYIRVSLEKIELGGIRVGAAIFYFEDGVLKRATYFPTHPSIEPLIFSATSELDGEINLDSERLIREVSLAIKTLEKFKPDFLLLDGPLIPYSAIFYSSHLSETITRKFEELTKTSKKLNSRLIGVIEDSRTNFLSKLLIKFLENFGVREKFILSQSNDPQILEYLLKEGEKTLNFFPIEKKPFNKVISFYFRISEMDKVIRVETLKNLETDKICKLLKFLAFSKEYTLPSVLIEIDRVVRLEERDVENIYREMVGFLGERILTKKRRKRRPL